MDTAEIRRRFVGPLRARPGTPPVPSASLLLDDPNLLFVNAGMVPFKPYFLGQETPPYDRAVSVQKCVRTPDIEDVGKTTRHGTFFEMCGNFSFGDYFKEGAIELGWELVTRSQSTTAAWASRRTGSTPPILDGDDEALGLWRRSPGCPTSGSSGWAPRRTTGRWACPGPAARARRSSIDRGPDVRRPTATSRAEDRYLEFWNLVFMQDELSRGAVQGGLRHRRLAAEEEHRHRHGPRAGRLPAPGRREHVRDRRHVPGHREGRGAHRPPLRRRRERARRRRPVPRGRRPRPLLDDADQRRRHARQRGPRLRAAPAAAPRRPLDAAARLRGPRAARAAADLARQDGGDLRRAAPRLGADLDRRVRRGGRVPADAARRHRDLRPGHHRGEAVGRRPALGRQGVRAARHLRLPDRPDPRDGGRAGAERRRGRLPPADGRAARPRQGRRARQEGPAPRRLGLPRGRRLARPRRRVHRLRRGRHRGRGARHRHAPAARWSRPARATSIELVLDRTPFYAEGGGQLADQGVIELDNGARIEVRDVQSPITGLVVHQARVLSGEVTLGASRAGAGRRRAAPLDLALAHRDPHGAQGVPRGARRDRDPGRLGEHARPVPVRLLRHRRGARRR